LPKQTFFNLPKEKQDQIICVAISEFSEGSFKEVKISDIINQAKIPRSSFYDYFEDKEDLYDYIIGIIKKEKAKFMAPMLQKRYNGFFEKLKELFRAGSKFAVIRPEYEKLANKMYEDTVRMGKVLEGEQPSILGFYESMIQEGVEAGELRSDLDIQFAAQSLYILSANLMTAAYENGKEALDERIEERASKMLDFIKRGMAN
jgi:AcrR family transcriptional regulator